MKQALEAWLDAAARTGEPVAAARSAAEAVAAEPWRVITEAGALARARWALADADLGLSEELRRLSPGSPRAIVVVPRGAPWPALDAAGRRARGAFDTPAPLARRVVSLALSAARRPVRCALDPACGTGAFLVALGEAGVPEITGVELDPVAAAVAAVAAPRARLIVGDGLLDPEPSGLDLVVGNPPFVARERQSAALKAELAARFPWLTGRYDLSVPFAASAAERLAPGGGLCLVLPAASFSQPYGEALRRRWVAAHRLVALEGPRRFPGVMITVGLVALDAGGGPAPLPDHGLDPITWATLPSAPWMAELQPGDPELLSAIVSRSQRLGALCEIDTGVVSHGPDGGKAELLHDRPGPGRVPYVDTRDLLAGRRRWLDYDPARMHRAKRPALFAPPKLLVQRVRGEAPVRVWVDHEGLFAGHTLTVLRPYSPDLPVEALAALLRDPLTAGLLRLMCGDRIDLYPHDLAALPIPLRWPAEADLARAWGLDAAQEARLHRLALGPVARGGPDH